MEASPVLYSVHREIMLRLQITFLQIFLFLVEVKSDSHVGTDEVTNSSIPANLESNCSESCVVSCPKGWERFGEHCYFWSKDEKDWHEAEKTCRCHGGHLASITDQTIQDYMSGKGVRAWIGGTDEAEEGAWVWSDGSAWGFKPQWKINEPNNGWPLGEENCVELFYQTEAQFTHRHGWNDEPCSEKGK